MAFIDTYMQETATNSTILQLKMASGRHFVLRHGQLSTLICSVGVPIFSRTCQNALMSKCRKGVHLDKTEDDSVDINSPPIVFTNELKTWAALKSVVPTEPHSSTRVCVLPIILHRPTIQSVQLSFLQQLEQVTQHISGASSKCVLTVEKLDFATGSPYRRPRDCINN